MSVPRPHPLLGLACGILALLLAPGSPGAASKVIGGTEPGVRILRGTAPAPARASAARGDSISALLAPPPAAADSAARAWTLRLVAAYGGPAALLDWVERGERRGLQVTASPVRIDARVRERRAGSRLRIDARVAGVEFTMVSTADEQWQSVYGIVSDLPEQEREAIASARAHDEGLLLAALKGTFPARLDPATADSDTIGLLVWGSRGSATRFRATRADGRLHAIEFVDRDPEAAGDVFQVVRFADWRPVGPGLPPLVARHEGHVPLRMIELVDGVPSGESFIDTLDLAQEVPAELFLRPDAPRAGTGAPRRSIIALERHGDHHFADVRFADGVARRFLVDSGAAVTAVSRELAATLKLATGEKLDVAGVGGGAAAAAALLPPFDLGSHRLTGVRGIVLDLAGLSEALSTRIDGVLGVSSFARFAVTWDFERGVLEIAESRDPQASSPRGTRVPFTMAGGLVFVPVRVDGGAATDFVADTGAWRTFLSATLAGTVDNPPEQRLPGIPYSGVDGRRVETEALRLRSLEIGGLTVPRPIVLAPSARDGTNDALGALTRDRGVLGLDVLRRFRLTLDFPRQELLLEPVSASVPAGDEPIDAFCGPGIALSPGEDGAGARVTRVLRGSPAAVAGVVIGDRVLAIDGRSVDQASATRLFELLAGPAGTPVSLRVRRADGGERTVKLVRALLI